MVSIDIYGVREILPDEDVIDMRHVEILPQEQNRGTSTTCKPSLSGEEIKRSS